MSSEIKFENHSIPEEKMDNIIKEMCIAPDWCPDIPLEAEGGYAENYSK